MGILSKQKQLVCNVDHQQIKKLNKINKNKIGNKNMPSVMKSESNLAAFTFFAKSLGTGDICG